MQKVAREFAKHGPSSAYSVPGEPVCDETRPCMFARRPPVLLPRGTLPSRGELLLPSGVPSEN